MRSLIPAALLLAYACGSSNPEPVSAPTPADSAALARATPHAFIAAREQYYDIDGSSAGALRDQIRRLGPKDESGTSHDALTVWSLEWAYATAQRGDGCALRDVDRKSTRLNSSHLVISYAVFCLKKKKIDIDEEYQARKI